MLILIDPFQLKLIDFDLFQSFFDLKINVDNLIKKVDLYRKWSKMTKFRLKSTIFD